MLPTNERMHVFVRVVLKERETIKHDFIRILAIFEVVAFHMVGSMVGLGKSDVAQIPPTAKVSRVAA
ncbi:hypothetical protein ABH14_11735 [Brevibacillus brevis]|uniref:hypothetical protein n=1 Tax=Brevibacillus brevis TaxID=1393 RepID=UPI0018FF6B2F|nr:hypothetical protein [Brevibacillus brevis]MBH0330455.1 hypothetical protein [Brevibacillus brevis]